MTAPNITRVTPVSVHFDGRMYPLAPENLAWRLVHTPESITPTDMMHAASIISAYEWLVWEPERVRRVSVRAIREGMNRNAVGESDGGE